MLSYTGRRNLFGTLTNNSTSANLTTADTLMNVAEKRILALFQWPFLERTDTATTSAATQFIEIPQRIGKLETLSVTLNNVTYTPKEVSSERDWQVLTQTSISSDIPTHFYKRAGKVGLFPTPLNGGATVNFFGRAVPKDLSIADYTTGGVLTATNGSTAIVGTGTTWTASMAGRFLRITESDTANKGDGYWYEIVSSGSTTTITLFKSYQGTSIAAGNAAYIVGQMSLLPEAYCELPVYDALRTYFTSIQPDTSKAQLYDRMYKEMEARLFNDFSVHTGQISLQAENINYE